MVPIQKRQSDASSYRTGMFDTTCKPGMSWVKWCPIDVILWALLLIIIVLIGWKVYISKRFGSSSRSQRNRSNGVLCYRLPYPSEAPESPFNPYRTYKYENKQVNKSASSETLVDPYLRNRPLDESLIAKDGHFTKFAVPQTIFNRKSNERLLGLALVIDSEQSAAALKSPRAIEKNKELEAHPREAPSPITPPAPAYMATTTRIT